MGFSLGTDLEFVLVNRDTGEIRPPHDLIRESFDERYHRPLPIFAIGKDGDRDTSSIELRPGVSDSAEALVDSLGDLLKLMENAYHPKEIIYRCGAWVRPEPLGWHIHLSLTQPMDHVLAARMFRRVLVGWRWACVFLVQELFPKAEVAARLTFAQNDQDGHDFGFENSIRPHTIRAVVRDNHMEYRYPPSWLLTPEHAFCFLGAAEIIARVVDDAPMRRVPGGWRRYTSRLFTDDAIEIGGISLAKTFKVAKRHTNWEVDFVENWI